MEFSIKELVEMRGGLEKLCQIKDPPALFGFKVAALVRNLKGPVEDALKAKNDLILKYAGKPDENGAVSVLPENVDAYTLELNELQNAKVDIDVKELKIPSDMKLPDSGTLVGLDRFVICG